MSQYDTFIHLVAGGIGGTAGAIATCPLEVVKTRLQSSVYTFGGAYPGGGSKHTHGIPFTFSPSTAAAAASDSSVIATTTRRSVVGIWNCLKYIVETEGTHALFKGLGPNLVGVAPSRAIYFCTYSQSKRALNTLMIPESHMVHILSAAFAGFASSTLTNPIWMVKTRLQLDQSKYGTVKLAQVIKDIYAERGFKGFYKGITASYYGVSETIIHFVIYESLKARLQAHHHAQMCDLDEIHQEEIGTRDLVGFMVAGAISKTCASCITYPHEVVRTRLRQSGNKYRSFFQTLFLVFQEEGYHGLYRGLGTQLVRQIPNTAIMMATYEAVVYLLNGYHPN